VRLELQSAARAELIEAAQYYEAASPGLGFRYLDEMQHCLDLMAVSPEIGVPCGRRLRRLVSGGDFPFSVVYEVQPQRILIVAFANQYRKPGYWKGRRR
jgi:toxin ParE1/3/4